MSFPILMYHSIDDSSSVLSISPALFEWQMRWISERGYRVLPLSQVVENIKTGIGFPNRSISITFDDGYETVFQNAFPILAKYGFSATIFLVAGYIGGVNNWPGQPANIPKWPLASWSQIREMDQYGIEYGSHSTNHPRLDLISIDDARQAEICNSKTIIEQELGHAIGLFAFPYGKYNPLVLAQVESAYAGACSTDLGLAGPSSNPYELERVEMYYLRNPRLFGGIAGPLLRPYLSVRKWMRALASKALRRQW
jgi:peptidoglycan/xylan/chitin deacetylase (PgdA/CDA1 family)